MLTEQTAPELLEGSAVSNLTQIVIAVSERSQEVVVSS